MTNNHRNMAKIVQTRTFVTLLGAGSTQLSQVKQALKCAPTLVAADGGADTGVKADLIPDAVIGDMDSMSEETRQRLPVDRLHRVAEQDTTDFEKCLQRIDAPAVLALGFTGSRLDHSLAACAALSRFPDMTVLLISGDDICFLAPATLKMELPVGSRLSIFPLAPTHGESEGLKYPLNGVELSPTAMVGPSNEVTGAVTLRFPQARPLILLPYEALETALAVLTA